MKKQKTNESKTNFFFKIVALFVFIIGIANAQDRLKNMPGYTQYQKMSTEMRGAVKMANLMVTWKDEGKAFEYHWDGKKYRYEISKKKAVEIGISTQEGGDPFRRMGRRGFSPERGRQWTFAVSPDGKYKAFYSDRNMFLSDTNGNNKFAITTEGNEKDKTKFGSASWVYGEELDQVTAMWWSPDSKKIAFYRFDESGIKDYHVVLKQTSIQDSLYTELYTKVGSPNPLVDVYVYDIDKKTMTKLDVRDSKPFDTDVIGHYVYGFDWTDDSKELLFHRTNRRQNIMEYCAGDPVTAKCRVVIREEWLSSFTENSPTIKFLKDGKRFIWLSERTGFKNYYLYDLSGKLLSTLTNHQFEVANIVNIDEKANLLYYMARDGDNHMKLQLHVVGLDGKNDKRLTDPKFNHSVNISPDGKYFIDAAQTHDIPPFTQLVDIKGKVIEVLAKSDMTKFDQIGLKKVELITFKAADGKTELHGMLNFPSNFDPGKKYPVIVSVYGGPATNAARETFSLPSSMTEYGFIVVGFDSRSAAGRGKRFLDQYYGNFGIIEMDDQAEGVKSLWERPYIDKNNVGIFGTSFGGTSAATCLLRFPDVFQAAVANSGVYDFRNYDNIYTERFMGLLEDKKPGWDKGNPIKYVNDLKGRLMIYYGTADDNVHPSNSMQLINALQRARKSFEVQVGPDRGHTALDQERMMEFFIENLVIK